MAGLGVITPVSFALAATSGIEWFADLGGVSGPQALANIATNASEHEALGRDVARAWQRQEQVLAVDEQVIDISDHSLVDEALAASRQRVSALHPDTGKTETAPKPGSGRAVTVGMHLHETESLADQLRRRAEAASPRLPVDYGALQRRPFPHQRDGIEWITGLLQSAFDSSPDDPARVQGALLADDMGLGKTYMILAALAHQHRTTQIAGSEQPPVLAVMPAALLENWLQEVRSVFGSRCGPFDDIVVLQGTGLDDYRLRGAGRETSARVDDLDEHGMVRPDRIHVSLRVGPSYGPARLDRPGVLVLATYETLRRYQVSLGLVDWGVVVLDEAQATKNPEILTSRAAKGLKARFKLVVTGTPVENSLRDFWSLTDTAQPGLLGSWAQFHSTWVVPMESATADEHQSLGRQLRQAVGPFMLRRVKEDHLPDLPAKHVHEYRQIMPDGQVRAYDDVLAAHKGRAGTKGGALKTLHHLAQVSLHPDIQTGLLSAGADRVNDSARTLATVGTVLDAVRDKNEKAIVFAKTKAMQRALAMWLLEIYGLRVDVVNGDTTATGLGSSTRLGKIRAFEERTGFNVIIMSPLAVGVGLTVVGANHAVHLERHWNPAKEAQATDRVHRIGQRREVHVHYPMACHPSVESFDLKLDRLLRTKTALKDAVVAPQEVSQEELGKELGLI